MVEAKLSCFDVVELRVDVEEEENGYRPRYLYIWRHLFLTLAEL